VNQDNDICKNFVDHLLERFSREMISQSITGRESFKEKALPCDKEDLIWQAVSRQVVTDASTKA
jgi:hypothetical protein